MTIWIDIHSHTSFPWKCHQQASLLPAINAVNTSLPQLATTWSLLQEQRQQLAGHPFDADGRFDTHVYFRDTVSFERPAIASQVRLCQT